MYRDHAVILIVDFICLNLMLKWNNFALNLQFNIMEFNKDVEKLIVPYWFVILSLIICSCTNEPENIAISPDGVEISFLQQGKGEPALIFVHGWSNNKSIWDAQVAHFSEKYKVVTVDLAGFGESGNERSEWTMTAFGEDVTAVIQKLKLKKVVLVGFSLGAPVVIETANMVPSEVKGVVVVDALRNVGVQNPPEAFSYIDSMMMDLVNSPSMDKLRYFFRNDLEESYERVLSMLGDNPKIGWSESIREGLRWQNENCIESLSRIRVPVQAINSGQEPTDVEAFRQYVPSFKARIIPEVGHVVMWDATDEFNSLLEDCIKEFLSE
jgi:pimeloyl-ACP methyl ester carboxylesterase